MKNYNIELKEELLSVVLHPDKVKDWYYNNYEFYSSLCY